MYHMDTNKLNGKIVERETTKEAVADEIGIDRSTFYRRLKDGKLRIGDMHKICDALVLTKEEAIEIFLVQ
ncbi:MAG: phage repressor protein [Eubacterium sp.]|nr:phage repressor protein [Eubacterium sp.]